MKRMWMVGVLALVVAAVAAAPAGAAGNADNAKLCQKGGWQTLFRSDGSTFANQGDCVSYAAKGNTILTAPPNPWFVACQQVGGTPAGALGSSLTCWPVSLENAINVLQPVCFAFPGNQSFIWFDQTATCQDF